MNILSDNFPYHYGTCDCDCWLGAPVHFTGTLHCQHFSISTLNNSGFFPHLMSLLHSVEGRNYNASSSFESILSIQRLMAALRNSMVTGQVRLNSLLIMHMVIASTTGEDILVMPTTSWSHWSKWLSSFYFIKKYGHNWSYKPVDCYFI